VRASRTELDDIAPGGGRHHARLRAIIVWKLTVASSGLDQLRLDDRRRHAEQRLVAEMASLRHAHTSPVNRSFRGKLKNAPVDRAAWFRFASRRSPGREVNAPR
jgi:hypothetical protein